MNCPHLPPDDPRSHSLLLERGLIRVALPWPPRNADGSRIDPEFAIEVVRDPSGCNIHGSYGLESANATIAVFRGHGWVTASSWKGRYPPRCTGSAGTTKPRPLPASMTIYRVASSSPYADSIPRV